MALDITTTQEAEHMLIQVAGEVDVSNAAELRTALESALADGSAKVEIDFTDVSYIDSTGIGVLVGAAHRAHETGATFTVAHPQKNVARVFDLLGVSEDLHVCADDERR